MKTCGACASFWYQQPAQTDTKPVRGLCLKSRELVSGNASGVRCHCYQEKRPTPAGTDG